MKTRVAYLSVPASLILRPLELPSISTHTIRTSYSATQWARQVCKYQYFSNHTDAGSFDLTARVRGIYYAFTRVDLLHQTLRYDAILSTQGLQWRSWIPHVTSRP